MSDYLIIDSNVNFANKLYAALTGRAARIREEVVAPSGEDVGALSDRVAQRLSGRKGRGEPNTIILMNAEAAVDGACRQQQPLVELAFWLRAKHRLPNAIVFYSLQSLGRLMKDKPEHFIITAPGSYHLRLPISEGLLAKLSGVKPLTNQSALKPFLKARINIERMRHRYANYAGMALMLNAAKKVWGITGVPKSFLKVGANLTSMTDFRASLDYHLLATYYDLTAVRLDESRNGPLKLADASKKILLIDDMADQGWKLILSQMVYGDPGDKRLSSLTLPATLLDLGKAVRSHKPHLLLLDLRLSDETGKRPLDELEGYQLLTELKAHPNYKGIPVIMFTASSNAETTKKLIEAGAEAVWTKPGLDEGLAPSDVLDRYADLLKVVDRAFNKFKDVRYSRADPDFSQLRVRLFEKMEWLKYRLLLYREDQLSDLQQGTDFKDFTDIYVDTNLIMSSHGNVDIVESLCNLYTLARVTAKTKKYYGYDQGRVQYSEPKVVVPNQVFDELVKKIKQGDDPMNILFYMVLRDLSGQVMQAIRTEYDQYTADQNFKPQFTMRVPKENVYADPFILDDISHLLVLGYKKMRYADPRKARGGGKGIEKKVEFPDRKVLLVSDDGDLVEKARLMFPQDRFSFYSIAQFNNEVRKIDL